MTQPARPLLLLLLLSMTVYGQEDSPRSQSLLAIGAICSDRQVPDSVLHVRGRAASLSVESRYDFLLHWVLPSSTHTTLRLALDFTTTDPAPGMASDSLQSSPPTNNGAVRMQTGGELVSPALDLVATAATLGRLAELRAAINRATSEDELQQRCRLSMLGMADLAAGEYEQAISSFSELFARVETRTFDDIAGRWPETLAIHVGLQHAETREVAGEMLYRILQSQVRVGVARGPDAWDRWVTGRAGRLTGLRLLRDADHAVSQGPSLDAEAGSYWLPVSKAMAWSRGRGLPCAAWMRQPGLVQNLASHDEDYLYYRMPLRGNFEVECDVTSFGWRDSHLMVAGTWVAPVYGHVSYGVGTFRGARSAGVITPRLSECDEWIRYRAVVRGGECKTYFNGRHIHTEPLTEEADPWLAIRSPWYTDGSVRDLRITGNPVIPEQIRLSTNVALAGWSGYYGESVGGEADQWCQRGDVARGGGIVGRHEAGLKGLACERLLQYHRPMLEDGTIEYEFYYREGETLVHPTLDRRAWILSAQGIQTHWITDGNFERSGVDPMNLTDETANRRGPASLPLQSGAWNRLRLKLVGDTVELALNEVPVYRCELESTNQRTFGLFHWADQTEVRVRNVVWRGAWPHELPAVEVQELAGAGTRWLDSRLPELTARFEHDFTRDGLPLERFLAENKTRQSVEASDNGVRVVMRGGKGYTPWWIGPNMQLQGDFDIRAEFDNLQLSGTVDSSTGVFLQVVMSDPETTHAAVYRGCLRKPNANDRIIAQAEFNRIKPSGMAMSWPGSTAEESTAGTLRLARRGDTIYCLFAEADSPHFRSIHSEIVPRAAIRFDGVRLMNSISSAIDGPNEVAVTWKRLSIWAEQISAGAKRRVPGTPSPME